MDLGLPEKFGFENRHASGLAAPDWYQIGSSSSCNWNQPSDAQSLSFPMEALTPNASSTTNGRPVHLNWNASDSAEKGEVFFSLLRFASDAGFIERAAGLSCFVSDSSNDVAEAQMQMNDAGKIEAFKDRSNGENSLMDQREDWKESAAAKKRKRSCGDQIQDAAKNASNSKKKAEKSSSTMATVKPSGKNSREVEEDGKEDYIHVRARRGQATNSHSLAERVRREKISERMKFLQDLVPGCSKVTGKAVMLDEIINYVQSLQRQVEFLSMKLAAVNPRLEFSLEGLLSKDLIHHQLHSLHRGLIQVGLPGFLNPSDGFRRSVNVHLPSASGGYQGSEQQDSRRRWEDRR